MILFKHQNPKAFGAEWKPLPRLAHRHIRSGDYRFNFKIHMYQIFGVEYHRDNEEFRSALEQYNLMARLRS